MSSAPAVPVILSWCVSLALALSVVLVGVVEASPVEAQAQAPSADVRLQGLVEQRPDGGGISTGSEIGYRITIENNGPDAVPAQAISLVMFVNRSDSPDMATMEVSRFSSRGLQEIPGNACGQGRHQVIRCTNRSAIEPNGSITVELAHRHPASIAGQLSFFAEVSPRNLSYIDGSDNNNAFGGPGYRFANQPTTTTTAAPSTTTTTTPSSTTEDSSTSSSDSTDSSTSSTASSTTAPSTTTSTTSTTVTTTTSTTTPSTTSTTEATTTSIELTDSDATLVPADSTDSSVLGAVGTAEEPGEQVALGPQDEDGGGPPYLLIGALAAALVLLGGVGLAAYSYYYNQDPPLVDIRQYH